jgi:hypothetical protein
LDALQRASGRFDSSAHSLLVHEERNGRGCGSAVRAGGWKQTVDEYKIYHGMYEAVFSRGKLFMQNMRYNFHWAIDLRQMLDVDLA